MKFARRVFLVAGIYGVIALLPLYFLENRIAIEVPPAITHPEFFYGFIGIGLAWQILFLIMSRDPVRLRPVIPAAILEKLAYGIGVAVLFLHGRVTLPMFALSSLDLVFAALFMAAYWKLGSEEAR